MARRSGALQRLIDDADQSLNLLASLNGLTDASGPRSAASSNDGAAFALGSSSSSVSSIPFLSAPASTDERAPPPTVDRSVRAGLLHVRGVFPDHSVEFVDVDPRFATVGELKRALCAKRAPQRDLGFDAAGARLMLDAQLADDDWELLDCALGSDATIHVVKAFGGGGGGFLAAGGSGFGFAFGSSAPRHAAGPKLSISSIASVYGQQQPPPLSLSQFGGSSSSGRSDGGFQSSLALSLAGAQAPPAPAMSSRAETLARQTRPEEASFAEIAADFYDHLPSVQNTDLYCEKLLGGYIDVLQARLESLEAAAGTRPRLHDDVKELRDERNTWHLLFALRQICRSGDTDRDSSGDDDALMRLDGAESERDAAELHFDTMEDDALRALATRNEAYKIQHALKAWLEHMALERTVPLGDPRAGGSRTLKLAKKGLLLGPRGAQQPVRLDPDAARRDGDEHVVDDDAEDEADLLKRVWQFVRAGRAGDAAELCLRAGQGWRAASLSGGAPLGVGESNARRDEPALERWGNPLRALWKTTCWQLSEPVPAAQLRLTKGSSLLARQYEEVVYAALSGNVAVIAKSPLCESWEDHVWAHVSAMTEQQQDEVLHRLLTVKLQSSRLVVGNDAHFLRHYAALLERTKYLKRYEANLDALFEELKGSRVESVRAQANEPHRHIQAKLVTAKVEYIVSRILDALLFSPADDAYHWDLQLHAVLQADALSPLFLRFAAHFVLFAAFTGEKFDEQAGHMILKAYIRHLVQHRQLQLVPVYASRLPYAGAVEVYVQLLATVDDSLERELVLKRVLQFSSMDVLTAVLQIAVARMGDEYRAAAQAQEQPQSQGGAGLATAPSLLDRKRMRTVEFLCFYSAHRAEALACANALAREFVREGKFALLPTLFGEHVPEDSLAVIDLHRSEQTRDDAAVGRAVREALCWKAYIAAGEQYDAWRDCLSSGGSAALTLYSEEKEFLTELMYHASRASNALLEALHFEGGWLMRCLDSAADEVAVRQLCLPLLVFNLHYVELESARAVLRLRFYPEAARAQLAQPLLAKSLQVADVVADERYGVSEALSHAEQEELSNRYERALHWL
ncbi:hypothetical protein PybrP1_006525 [[Pythium] brassicae (nom. inval.)]|nr:hypothetical protein PybrP1_006525 [[Pythium] brassicae (nom. inval.)]